MISTGSPFSPKADNVTEKMKTLMLKIFVLIGLILICRVTVAAAAVEAIDEVVFSRRETVHLSVTANFYEGDEDELVLPFETDVYLLPESIVGILRKKNFAPENENGKPLAGEDDFLDAIAHTFGSSDEESELLGFLIRETINEKKIIKITTDSGGRAAVRVKSGIYYLFAFKETDGEIFVWHFPVDLILGRKIIEIDQHNADAVFNLK